MWERETDNHQPLIIIADGKPLATASKAGGNPPTAASNVGRDQSVPPRVISKGVPLDEPRKEFYLP